MPILTWLARARRRMPCNALAKICPKAVLLAPHLPVLVPVSRKCLLASSRICGLRAQAEALAVLIGAHDPRTISHFGCYVLDVLSNTASGRVAMAGRLIITSCTNSQLRCQLNKTTNGTLKAWFHLPPNTLKVGKHDARCDAIPTSPRFERAFGPGAELLPRGLLVSKSSSNSKLSRHLTCFCCFWLLEGPS